MAAFAAVVALALYVLHRRAGSARGRLAPTEFTHTPCDDRPGAGVVAFCRLHTRLIRRAEDQDLRCQPITLGWRQSGS